MGRVRIRLKNMKTSSKIKTFLIIFFIAIFAIITARHFIGLHFKKKFSVRPAPGVIVSTVEKSLFYKSIETFGTAIAQNSKTYRVRASEIEGKLNIENRFVKKDEIILTLKDGEELKADFAGKVGKREIAQGVLGSESLIITLDDLEKIVIDIKVPENYLDQYPYKEDIGSGAKLRDEKLGPFPRTHHAVKVHRQEYYAIIEHMDTQIGRILDALERSGQIDNTYIFFTADHGLAVGHHGLFGKQNLYEHSTRVPFIAVGPEIKSEGKINTPIYLQDVMATSLDIADANRPEQVEFQSLMPILNGTQKQSHVKAVYGAYLRVQRSVTVGNWKLILYPKIAKARLFNIKRDPLEMNDLVGDESKAALVKRLYKRLIKLQKAHDDTLDLKEAFPKLG